MGKPQIATYDHETAFSHNVETLYIMTCQECGQSMAFHIKAEYGVMEFIVAEHKCPEGDNE